MSTEEAMDVSPSSVENDFDSETMPSLSDEKIERRAKLGFIPQSEVKSNILLPYADRIDEESNKALREIKKNLSQAVVLRDIDPGCRTWTARLSKYISLYGYKFSKEDHVAFVKLVYDLLLIPELEVSLVVHFSSILTTLLKKRRLLTSDDVILPWRPLYDLYVKYHSNSYEHMGMLHVPEKLKTSLVSAVDAAKVYFPSEATEEILEVLRPLMCPFDMTMLDATQFAFLFLPSTGRTLSMEKEAFQAWVDELMQIWISCQNVPSWDICMMVLITNTAMYNVGKVNWEPYMPFMFSRMLQCFNLPVSYKSFSSNRNMQYSLPMSIYWIVYTLGGGSSCQKHLTAMFKALESYFHPSNEGPWMRELQEFIRKLPAMFVVRLRRERSGKKCWFHVVPKSHFLTEKDVTDFVEALMPAALQSMYAKSGPRSAGSALHYLAELRPDLILPPILERCYSALDTVTEPHRLTSSLHCLSAVARTLVRGGTAFPEGPTHVMPILLGVLPGIDSNDLKKTMDTLHLLGTLITMVPIVDCSAAPQYYSDLNEVELNVCASTASMEDFVVQLLDRCLSLVETSTLEHTRIDRHSTRMSKEEAILEANLSTLVASVLSGASPPIFDVALRKLHSFVSGRAFEVHVAGKLISSMCRSASHVNPEKTLKMFFPAIYRSLSSFLEHDENLKEEILDNEVLFNLQLLSEVIRCNGNYLLPYRTQIEAILDRALKLTCKDGYKKAGRILHRFLRCMTVMGPEEFRIMPHGYEKSLREFLPIRHWGQGAGKLEEMNLQWMAPNSDTLTVVTACTKRYLVPELERLSLYCEGGVALAKEDIQMSLNIIGEFISGTGTVLPTWEDPPITLVETAVSLTPMGCYYGYDKDWMISLPGGKHIRREVLKVITRLVEKLLTCAADDTESLELIIHIYELLVSYVGIHFDDHQKHLEQSRMLKQLLSSDLNGWKDSMRLVWINLALMQHEARILEHSVTLFMVNEATQTIVNDLVTLATSHYSKVRVTAQDTILRVLNRNRFIHLLMMPRLLTLIDPTSQANHEQFKGALHLLINGGARALVVKRDWKLLSKLWPALVASAPSEKLSVIRLLDEIPTCIEKRFISGRMRFSMTGHCFEAVKALQTDCCPTEAEIQSALEKESTRSQENEKYYYELIDQLIALMNSGNLHWRHYGIGMEMLSFLVRWDLQIPASMVRLFVNSLIHDTLAVRKLAIGAMSKVFKLQKRPHPKIFVDPEGVASRYSPPVFDSLKEMGVVKEEDRTMYLNAEKTNLNRMGDRYNNLWMQYCHKNRPQSAEEWEANRFVQKTHYGYYNWPKEMMVYAPSAEQPTLDRSVEELTPAEREIHTFFSNPDKLEKLIGFLSLEEKKGKDRFSAVRFWVFKGFFRNHGDTYWEMFKPHLERLVTDTHESSHRCASEIITGVIRGSKHWPYDKVEKLWAFLVPLLRTAFNSVTVESIKDWATAVATASESRDPNRYHWMFELLMEDPIRVADRSFNEAGRLYLVQGGLAQQEWRVAELLHRLLRVMTPYLTHPYQNVRDRMGSVLTNLFLYDLRLPNSLPTLSPRVADFLQEILPKLAVLLNNEATQEEAMEVDVPVGENGLSGSQNPEKETALILLKTMCQWVAGIVARSYAGIIPQLFQLLPYICLQDNSDLIKGRDMEKDLSRDCIMALAYLSQALLTPESIQAALTTVQQITDYQSWKARASCLEFLQVMVFHNQFNILSHPEWIQQIVDIVLKMLLDERLEVREKAAQVLGGLLHCGLITNERTEELLAKFHLNAKTRLPKRRAGQLVPDPEETTTSGANGVSPFLKRHGGVLGLCAFVNAYPYDVPDMLPDILVTLGNHLNDPQPIPLAVKKTLSNFRRTHHDSWHDHKSKFTDDQLVTLTDLLVSPNYYA